MVDVSSQASQSEDAGDGPQDPSVLRGQQAEQSRLPVAKPKIRDRNDQYAGRLPGGNAYSQHEHDLW